MFRHWREQCMKPLNQWVFVGAVCWLGGLAAAAGGPPQVVFDNTANLINKTPEFAFAREYGDELAIYGLAADAPGGSGRARIPRRLPMGRCRPVR